MIVSNQKQYSRVIMAALFAFVVIWGFLSYIAPPSLFPDPANGFLVMRSMEMGGGFNLLISPSQDDLSKTTSEFLTWWSPGQYLVPYTIKLLFGVNTGQASALTITLCQLLGLAGFYSLFKKIGFGPMIAALSMLFIACQQFFVVPYVFYNGGEILSFAFTGWFLYGCAGISKTNWQLAVFILLSGWVGFFCKSSLMWVYGSGMLFIWIKLSASVKNATGWIKNGIWIALPAIVSIGTIYALFLSRGQNPASSAAGVHFSLKVLGFPLASPLLSGFSFDDLAHGLIYHTGKPLFTDPQAILVLALLAAASLWLVLSIIRGVRDQNYRLMLIIFYAVSILCFSYVYLRGMAISYEARHFRVIGLLAIPGSIYLFSKLKLPYRALFALMWIGIAITSLVYLVKGYDFNKNKSAHGLSGIAQQSIDQTSLNKIMALDRGQRNATFVFVDKDLGLEIRHNRMLALEPVGNELKIDLDNYEYDGHAGPLYIILPDSYAGPKEKFILKSFPGYKGWYGSMLSDKYVMYRAR